MADENISIEIADKVSPSISNKLVKIAENARLADAAVKNLKTQLGSLNTSALANIQAATQGATQALQQNALAAQRLATEQQRTATAAAQAAAAQQRVTTAATQSQTASQNLAAATTRANTAQAQGAAASQRLATEQARTATQTANAAAASDRAALAALRLQQAQDRAAQSSQRAASSIMSFVRGAAALVGVGLSAQAILQSADAYTVLQNKLQNVSETAAQTDEITNRLFETANRTRTPVQETAQAFTRFDMALKNLGKSQDDSLRLTETVNKMLVVSGATANEAGSALLQLSQAFNKGKLDGDEFRSVMELMPNAADAIAKRLGVTRGELLKLAPEGKITAQVMVDAFNDAAKGIDEKFGKTVPTLSQAMTVLRNNATQTFGEMNKSLGITAGLSNALIFLAENMKALAVAAAIAGAALLVAFGPTLVAAISSAASAVWAFTAALAANPIGLLVVGITAAIAAITVFGDEIAVTADKSITLKDMFRTAFAYISDAAGVAAEWIKSAWNSAINFINEKTNGLGEHFRNVGAFILNTVYTLVNTKIGLFVAAYETIIIAWGNFPGVMQAIFAQVVNLGISAVESLINVWQSGIRAIVNMAGGIAPELSAKVNNALDAVKIKIPRIEMGGAAKDAAGQISKAISSAMGKDYVGAAGKAFNNRMREVAAERRAAGGGAGLRGAGAGVPTLGDAAGGGRGRKGGGGGGGGESRADALAKVNRGLDKELGLMYLLKPEREIQQKFNQIEEQLLSKKIKLTSDEAAALKEKIKAIQSAKEVQQSYDRIYEEAVGPQRDYNANLTAAQKLLSQGVITQQQYNQQITKAGEAYKQATDPLYQYNKELEQQQTLLQMLPKQREVEQQIMQIGNDLLQKGVVLTQAETAALREKITVIQQLNAVSRQEAALMDASLTKRQAFIDQLTAIKNLRANQSSGFTAGDQANATNSMLQGMGVDITNFQSNIDAQLAMYQTYNDQIKRMYDERLITEQEYASASMQIELQRQNVHLNAANSFFGNLAALQKSGNKKMAAVGKAAAIAQAMISTYQSATSAYAAMASIPYVGPALGAAAAAAAIAAGLANVQQIRSQNAGFKEGGYTGSIGVNEVAGVVHGREYVMDANATARIGVANLQALQAGAANVQRNGEQAGAASVGSAPAAAPAPIVNVPFNAVVVQSKEAALAGLKSAEGQAFIIETIEQNGSTVAKIVGVK